MTDNWQPFESKVVSLLERILTLVERTENASRAILYKEVQMSAELDALKAQVTETATIEQSAITLLQGLAAQIESLKDDPVALAALATDLHASSAALAAAVEANTPPPPAAPNPEPTDPPVINV